MQNLWQSGFSIQRSPAADPFFVFEFHIDRAVYSPGRFPHSLCGQLCGNGGKHCLGPLFIFGAGPIQGMQAAGAAVATVCSQVIVTVVLVVCTLKSRKDADNENILKHMHLTTLCKKWYYREVCRIGIPSALQSIVYCGISMVLTRMVSSFGSAAVAAQRVGGQIESISWNTADGFGTAMNAFAGQNYGAGKMDRVKKSYHISLAAVGTWGLIITVVFLVAPEPISRIFFHEAESIQAFTGYLQVISVCEAFMCVELLTIGTLCGLGLSQIMQCGEHFSYQYPNTAGVDIKQYQFGSAGSMVGG